jgi:PAS domain S-box-containing protein
LFDVGKEGQQTALALEIGVLIPTPASLPMAVMRTDCNGVIRWANAYNTYLTGYAVEEIVGQNAGILLSEDTAHALHELLRHVIAMGETWRGQSIGRNKSGELYEIEQTSTPLKVGPDGLTQTLLTLQNMTEGK